MIKDVQAWFERLVDRLRTQKNPASVAKERLQIIVAHNSQTDDTDKHALVKALQTELLAVLKKYIEIDLDKIKVDLEQTGDASILELNITIDGETRAKKKSEISESEAVMN